MTTDGLTIIDRIVLSLTLVRRRLERAAAAFEAAGLPYAVLGGNAVFLWMTKHGEGAARFTPNVDLLIRRNDLTSPHPALQAAGFTSDPDRPDFLLDGADGSSRTRLRLLFAGEKVRDTDFLPNPDVFGSVQIEAFSVLDLRPLVQTKLTAFRTIDRVHLSDLLGVGLIDQAWTARYPPELAARLQSLLDDPDG